MKVCIAGCRHFTFIAESNRLRIINLIKDGTITELICGMASGIDLLAKELCEEYNIPVSEYPANWNDFSQPCKIKYNKIGKKYNALAGHKRNRLMAIDSDLSIAIWDGKSAGTNNMIKEMSSLNKPLIILYQ